MHTQKQAFTYTQDMQIWTDHVYMPTHKDMHAHTQIHMKGDQILLFFIKVFFLL